MLEPVLIASCPEHGPIRQVRCLDCGKPVEQVPMVPLAEQLTGDEIVLVMWRMGSGFRGPWSWDEEEVLHRSAMKKLEAMRDA